MELKTIIFFKQVSVVRRSPAREAVSTDRSEMQDKLGREEPEYLHLKTG